MGRGSGGVGDAIRVTTAISFGILGVRGMAARPRVASIRGQGGGDSHFDCGNWVPRNVEVVFRYRRDQDSESIPCQSDERSTAPLEFAGGCGRLVTGDFSTATSLHLADRASTHLKLRRVESVTVGDVLIR